MRRIVIAVAALAAATLAAHAAELPLAKLHTARVHRLHGAHVVRIHNGYYWGQWGARTGGSAGLWYRSTFGLGGEVLASSPRSVFAVQCNWDRPDACFSKPIVVPVQAARAY